MLPTPESTNPKPLRLRGGRGRSWLSPGTQAMPPVPQPMLLCLPVAAPFGTCPRRQQSAVSEQAQTIPAASAVPHASTPWGWDGSGSTGLGASPASPELLSRQDGFLSTGLWGQAACRRAPARLPLLQEPPCLSGSLRLCQA